MRKFASPLAALALLAGCAENPTSIAEQEDAAPLTHVVVTEGIPAPSGAFVPRRPSLSEIKTVSIWVGGSSTSTITLLPASCDAEVSQEVEIRFQIIGNQRSEAKIYVPASFTWSGTSFEASTDKVEIIVPERDQGTPTTMSATVTLVKPAGAAAGTATITIVPEIDTNQSDPPGQRLTNDFGDIRIDVDVHTGCTPVENKPPVLTLEVPSPVEATSAAGAPVYFTVTATDEEDGEIPLDQIVCTVGDQVIQSGDVLPIGTHTISCSVTDSGGATVSTSREVVVQDTTPPEFREFPWDGVELIAESIDGAWLDSASLGIIVEDVGNVSEPSTFACTFERDGAEQSLGERALFPIGETLVTCTATDARGNTSDPEYFTVSVGFDLTGVGFLPPLRMVAPFSAHQRNSTIPHKFPAPRYADGSLATDLAAGLRLVLQREGGMQVVDSEETSLDLSAGSTAWRYDPESGHYIFNLKTSKKDWMEGTWTTTVSYAGVVLASTQLVLK